MWCFREEKKYAFNEPSRPYYKSNTYTWARAFSKRFYKTFHFGCTNVLRYANVWYGYDTLFCFVLIWMRRKCASYQIWLNERKQQLKLRGTIQRIANGRFMKLRQFLHFELEFSENFEYERGIEWWGWHLVVNGWFFGKGFFVAKELLWVKLLIIAAKFGTRMDLKPDKFIKWLIFICFGGEKQCQFQLHDLFLGIRLQWNKNSSRIGRRKILLRLK